MDLSEMMKSMETMTHEELTQIMILLLRSWSRLHPEDELVVLSLPKHGEDRKKVLDDVWRHVMAECEEE